MLESTLGQIAAACSRRPDEWLRPTPVGREMPRNIAKSGARPGNN